MGLLHIWPSWPWSYGSCIYNYLCNRCLSPLMWVQIPLRRGVLDTTLCDKVTCDRSVISPVSSINKTDGHWNIVETGVKHYKLNQTKPYSFLQNHTNKFIWKILFFRFTFCKYIKSRNVMINKHLWWFHGNHIRIH